MKADRDDNCAGNADENDVSTSECISTRHVLFYNHTAKSNTIGGEKHIVNVFKSQLLETKLNWIHIITSSKCVRNYGLFQFLMPFARTHLF